MGPQHATAVIDCPRPGLLVSVRNGEEAVAALEGGADVIDVKQPDRGPLGRADASRVAEIVQAVARRRPVTAAAGDWGELAPSVLADWIDEAGAHVVKLGVGDPIVSKGAATDLARVRRLVGDATRLVPAVYADRAGVRALKASSLASLAEHFGGGWLVIDTFDKRRGDLFNFWAPGDVAQTLNALRGAGVRVVLAGSLAGASLRSAARMAPDLVGVRGAACPGGRDERVEATSVRRLVGELRAVRRGSAWRKPKLI